MLVHSGGELLVDDPSGEVVFHAGGLGSHRERVKVCVEVGLDAVVSSAKRPEVGAGCWAAGMWLLVVEIAFDCGS